MICNVSCSILLLASTVLAQSKLMPGTVASTAVPDSGDEGAPSTLSSSSSSSSSGATSSSSSDAKGPITGKERIQWVVKNSLGPEGLAGEVVGAGLGTLVNSPKVYGTHWEGFGDRLGMSVAGNLTSDTMEAGLGAAWGEDPRYRRDPGDSFGHRLGHAAKMTFMAENRDGEAMLAYARFIAIPGSNFVSNAWRAPGDDTVNRATIRTGLGFLDRFGSNVFDEFWPDVKQKMFHHGHAAE